LLTDSPIRFSPGSHCEIINVDQILIGLPNAYNTIQ
jgi:hypothetical protein